MYKTFAVQNFRKFQNLKLAELANINLIVGRNGSGKTSLLEALWFHSGIRNTEMLFRMDIFRGLPGFNVSLGLNEHAVMPWTSFFYHFDTSRKIQINSTNEENISREQVVEIVTSTTELQKIARKLNPDQRGSSSSIMPVQVLKVKYTDEEDRGEAQLIIGTDGITSTPATPTKHETIYLAARSRTLPNEINTRWSSLVYANKRDTVLKYARIFEPRLSSMEMLEYSGTSVLHCIVDGEPKPIPMTYAGDGFTRFVEIALALTAAPGGNVLVDEIDNGIHYSVLSRFWEGIMEVASDANSQLFATTHSHECIEAALEASSSNHQLRLIRMSQDSSGMVEAVDYDRDAINTAIEFNVEVR